MRDRVDRPTPANVVLDGALLQLTVTRPEVGQFIRKVYDLVDELHIPGKGHAIKLDGDDLVIRLRLR